MARKFTVAHSNGSVGAYEGDFEISKEGVLNVKLSEGETSNLLFAPHAWLCIDVKR